MKYKMIAEDCLYVGLIEETVQDFIKGKDIVKIDLASSSSGYLVVGISYND